jgi:Domain of unknown function (DUF4281)
MDPDYEWEATMSHGNGGQSLRLKLLFLALSIGGAPLALLMAFAPQASLTRRLVASNLLLQAYGGVYTVLFFRAILQKPDLFLAAAKLDVDSLVALTGKPEFARAVWAHASTCDLFIARWIYLDSMGRGHVARLPVLLQFVLGPVGLLVYLTLRDRDEAVPSDG